MTGSSEISGLSAPLYLLSPEEAQPQRERVVRKFSAADAFPGLRAMPKQPRVDSALQKQADAQQPVSLNAIFQGIDFEGLGNIDGVLPPDANLAAGPNHIVQMVNMHFEIWDKAGNLLLGPTPTTQLWSALGGPCKNENDGDGLAIYDQLADRWVMTQFAMPNCQSSSCNGPFYQCIAVSQTNDPRGAWYGYAFKLSDTVMNDYPKFSVWPDAYYMSDNQFPSDSTSDSGSGYLGVGAYAFDRNSMLQGKPATYVYFDLNNYDPNLFSMLPSSPDGPNPPPAGSPDYFVGLGYDQTSGVPINQLEIWAFHVDWNNTANSTFTSLTPLITKPFDASICDYGSDNCITQPGTIQGLDAIPDRVMYRLQYRNFGNYQTMVTNHTVYGNGTNAGIRWYELRNYGSGWQIYQQGTYSPDANNNRWMGSIAMDGAGNIALGYSVSSPTVYPSIRYTGRLASDPPGTMAADEITLISGGGYQTDSHGRWGDYSSMVVDPSDCKTFWYTQEYYGSTSKRNWQTRIGSFQLQSSSAPATHFAVYPPASVNAGIPFTFTITALDADNNPVVTGYTGTVYFSSTDPAATLPTAVKLTCGTGTFQATLASEGNQTVTAQDTTTASITGTSDAIAVIGLKLVSLTPSELTSVAGAPETFSAVYGDPAGYTSLKSVDLIISRTGSGANAIWARYNRSKNTLSLFNNAGTALISGSCTPGSPFVLQNAQGTLNCRQTSVIPASPDQNSITVNWSITPKAAFVSASPMQVLMAAKDIYTMTTGPTTMGSWMILTSQPSVVSFTPPPSLPWPASTPQTVTAVYGDNAGYSDIKNADLRISPAGNGVNSIWVRYNRNNNLLFIFNSAGTALKSGNCTPGGPGTLHNSNGTLNCQQTTVTGDGKNLTVNWNITPKPAFASAVQKAVQTVARDNSGLSSGWVPEGSWTISPQ